jgi:hypothetical protein
MSSLLQVGLMPAAVACLLPPGRPACACACRARVRYTAAPNQLQSPLRVTLCTAMAGLDPARVRPERRH